jgi:hypothetical protein
MERYKSDQMVELLALAGYTAVTSQNMNWYISNQSKLYIAQSKPSIYGRANWYFEFWNSIRSKTLDLIGERNAKLMLVDYVNSRYIELDKDTLAWVRENSSRTRKEEVVSEFVVKKIENCFYLVPYLTGTGLFNEVEVINFG